MTPNADSGALWDAIFDAINENVEARKLGDYNLWAVNGIDRAADAVLAIVLAHNGRSET